MTRLITALFQDRAAAERARQALQALGVPPGRIGLHLDPSRPALPATAHSVGAEPGLPALLDTLFLPEPDFAAHREALRRGGIVVAAEVEPAQAADAARALDEAGAEDLDAQEENWRREGWNPAAAAGAVANDPGAPPAAMPGTGGLDPEAARMLGSGSYGTSVGGRAGPDTRREGAQDPRRTARREPGLGRARSYVIEAPLAEQPGLSGQVANPGGPDRGAA